MSNITRVVVVDPFRPEVLRFGTSDLKRVDGLYVRVHFDEAVEGAEASQLAHAGFVFLASSADKVQSVFVRMKREEKELRDRHYREVTQAQKDFGAK